MPPSRHCLAPRGSIAFVAFSTSFKEGRGEAQKDGRKQPVEQLQPKRRGAVAAAAAAAHRSTGCRQARARRVHARIGLKHGVVRKQGDRTAPLAARKSPNLPYSYPSGVDARLHSIATLSTTGTRVRGRASSESSPSLSHTHTHARTHTHTLSLGCEHSRQDGEELVNNPFLNIDNSPAPPQPTVFLLPLPYQSSPPRPHTHTQRAKREGDENRVLQYRQPWEAIHQDSHYHPPISHMHANILPRFKTKMLPV